VGIQILKHDRKLGSEKVVQVWQSVIRHLSESSESRDRGRMLGSTVVKSEGIRECWNLRRRWNDVLYIHVSLVNAKYFFVVPRAMSLPTMTSTTLA